MGIDFLHILEQVKCLPMEQVIGETVSLKKSGSYYYGLCPFHDDQSAGSFVVTPKKNVWKCFACPDSPGGDAIDFVAKRYQISTKEAVLKIALDYKIIDDHEFDEALKQKLSQTDFKPVRKKAQKKTISIAKESVLDAVYSEFVKASGLLSKDRDYLQQVRFVPERLISDFFSYPVGKKRKQVMESLLEAMNRKNLEPEVLGRIPGFFWNKKTKSWDFLLSNGIGFLIRNARGSAVRIQIRKSRTEGKDQRYFWFSSGFADDSEKYEKGTSSGSPIDVIPPARQKFPVIAITEGKFKGVALSRSNLMAVSMQGVSNWRGVIPEIKNIMDRHPESYPKESVKIWICYDADILTNAAVADSAELLEKALKKEGLAVEYATWDIQYGKGIDDVINSGNKNTIQRTSTIPQQKTDCA